MSSDNRFARVIFNSKFDPLEWRMNEALGPGFASDGSANFAALAAVPFAMASGQDIHIQGRVCPILLGHLERFISNRVSFHHPDFKQIRITADEKDPVQRCDPLKPHVLAFSGNLASNYCVVKSLSDTDTRMVRPIGASVTIEGLGDNINPLPNFDAAFANATRIGRRDGFDSYGISTNILQLANDSWGSPTLSPSTNAYPLFVAASLNLFSENFGGGILPADFGYKEETGILAIASTSPIHPLLSSSGFPLHGIGSDADQSQRVSALWEKGRLSDVIFCTRPKNKDTNCGTCPNCRQAIVMLISRGIGPSDYFAVIPDRTELIKPLDDDCRSLSISKSILRHWTSVHDSDLQFKLWEVMSRQSNQFIAEDMEPIGSVNQREVEKDPSANQVRSSILKRVSRSLTNVFGKL